MKRIVYLIAISLTLSTVQAQIDLVPLARNLIIAKQHLESVQALPKWVQQAIPSTTKTICAVEQPGVRYVPTGSVARIRLRADTTGLGSEPGNYTCLNCDIADFGTAIVIGDTLVYTARGDVGGGEDRLNIEFCNPVGCRTLPLRLVVRRNGRQHFQEPVTLSANTTALLVANSSLLPGRQVACNTLTTCGTTYDTRGRDVRFASDTPTNRVNYLAGPYPGLDSVCVVLCDTFAICDTFRFAIRIQEDTLRLPIMDDFSYTGPVPDRRYWLDRDVFINNDMAENPPSFGVATFDGLNAKGTPYGDGYGESDRLTSKNIDLRNTGDTWLTYWLQRRGLGDRPEPQDSVVVEFKEASGRWRRMRSHEGAPISQPNTADEPFRFHRIQVPPEFKYNGFQFRFRNYSDRTGILDTWHLDYVRLDDNFIDSIFNDVAFTRHPNFILKRYSSMPWRHFKANVEGELRSDLHAGVWNHADTRLNVGPSSVRLFENYSNRQIFMVTLFNGETVNVDNGRPLSFTFQFNGDPTGFPSIVQSYTDAMKDPAGVFDDFEQLQFRMTYALSNTPIAGYEAVGRNNTVNRDNIFENYFAYDDGTAEAGLIAQNGVQVAVEFQSNIEDSLRAIRFHFPHTTTDISTQALNIRVWIGNLKPTPDYELPFQQAYYANAFFDTLQGFTTYVFEQPIYLPAGKFYVGWQQATPCDGTRCIPVGYDRNSPQGKDFMFRNLGTGWQPFPIAFLPGSIMIRPIVGNTTPPPTTDTDEVIVPEATFRLFPNPTREVLQIMLSTGAYSDFRYEVINALGNRMATGVLQERLLINNLPAGVYFLKILDSRTTRIWTERFIIAR
ncbi:MAG TPA: T9SS type A sorting domain-containing protein [Saprospiraceae bacterium]|nr:T9SS type A sorting domain-containing protein [Saprospiraceae bacterium]HMP14629.1 T9SS type A sorting domain-containing protein [Saprospiraceae bacterium]